MLGKYKITDETKNRAKEYLKALIANKGVTCENANSNISLVSAYLDAYNIEYKTVEKENHKALLTPKTGIVFNSHVDVVPGRENEFHPYERNNKLFGRGSADALGCAVSMIICAQELSKLNTPVTLMIVSDEEVGGYYGTKYILDNEFDNTSLQNIKYTVVGEPTEEFGFSIREKGILRLTLDVFGKRTHPEKGIIDNAIVTASNIINEVNSSSLLQKKDEHYEKMLHVNPTLISGGVASNIIPDKVTIEYDIRFAYGISKDDILQIFENLKGKYNFDYNIIKSRSASYVNTENKYYKLLNNKAGNPEKIVTNGASDYSYFFEKKIPGVVYGVKGSNWHKEEEYVELDSMYSYIENLINFVLEVD
ncbi:MAG: M20 family metallopeptidase [Nanobdellota archaeon]